MKKLVILCAVLALTACKKEAKEEKPGLGSVIEGVSNLNKMSKSMDKVQENIEELKATTPATNDELKSAIPETLLGMKRTEITVGSMSSMGLSSADAKYSSENGDKRISINIADGAGEAGSSIVSLFMLTLNADMEKTTEDGFEKTAEINGTKAFVSQNNGEDYVDSEIKYIVKGRYMINASGDGFTVEELAKALAEINLSKLP